MVIYLEYLTCSVSIADAGVEGEGGLAFPRDVDSSRGTISMRKSNWSDLPRALAISERESVRLLLESAMMNARAVISDIKTDNMIVSDVRPSFTVAYFRMLYRRGRALRTSISVYVGR
jgi:hypothetical protein